MVITAAAPALRVRRRRVGLPLPAEFYDRETALVARELLGAVLECRTRAGVTRGRIVETEAYLGPNDPACHAAAGITKRNRHLHGPPGTAYVYFIYGVHWCVNAVTRELGHGSAVLIRAVEPVQGLPLMRRRRGNTPDRDLANGPGKLCQALGIDGRHNGTSLVRGAVRILRGDPVSGQEVLATPRIGISKAASWPLRFVDATSAGASRARPSTAPRATR